jgi:sec-independent protein translocase protein TatA
MRGPQGWEWLVIALIVLLLFGARRLPDLARSVGRSLRILRTEVKEGGREEAAGPGAPDDQGTAGPRGPGDDGGPRA